MNTPAHLIFGLAVFGKADASKVTAAALAGAGHGSENRLWATVFLRYLAKHLLGR
ncbi:hypothetical protein [Octadecabacter antarcticus]|uniref:hypothetical protein n=1 Tax=Octadecabacter antarcticus TaxID=1217908 RepID=UPI00018069DE|nr:hypothetical protein [Octadecabacter antarcticus]